jgi:hypothetical protein
MKNQLLVVAALAIPIVATAFVAPRPTATRSAVVVLVQESSTKNVADYLSHALGVFAIGAILSFNPPMGNAAEIKTVDMSMPSYGTIAAPTASLESLTIAPPPDDIVVRPVKKKKEVVEKESGGGGMGAVLPSMNKKGPAGAKPRQLKVKQEVVEVAPVVVKKEVVVLAPPVKKEAPAVVVKKEAPVTAPAVAVAKKEIPVVVEEEPVATLTKKQAAKLAKEEAEADAAPDYGNIKIVDMGLPSYSDSTSTGNGKNSPFAIN